MLYISFDLATYWLTNENKRHSKRSAFCFCCDSVGIDPPWKSVIFRIGFETQPRRLLWRPCKTRLIPVPSAQQKWCFSFSVVGDPYAHRTQHLAQSATVHGFETLLRRFRVGSLVGRSKFPYKIPSGSMPSGFFSYSDADLYQVKHTPQCRFDQKNGARHNTKLICKYFFCDITTWKAHHRCNKRRNNQSRSPNWFLRQSNFTRLLILYNESPIAMWIPQRHCSLPRASRGRLHLYDSCIVQRHTYRFKPPMVSLGWL